MCKSLAEGGRRCAASLEPAFTKAIKAYRDNSSELTSEMMNLILPSAKAYASTRTGYSVIDNMINEETRRQLAGDYADFTFPKLGRNHIFYSARNYFIKNLPFTALLQIALEDGSKISRSYYEREQEINRIKQEKIEALKSLSLLPHEPEDKQAYETLESAIKQGKELASPAGAVVFKLTYEENDHDGAHNEFIGVYQSFDDAKRAAVTNIFNTLTVERSSVESLEAPWGALANMSISEWNNNKVQWFKSKTDDFILEWAKTDMIKEMKGFVGYFSETTFDISPIKVEAVSVSYTEETHLES